MGSSWIISSCHGGPAATVITPAVHGAVAASPSTALRSCLRPARPGQALAHCASPGCLSSPEAGESDPVPGHTLKPHPSRASRSPATYAASLVSGNIAATMEGEHACKSPHSCTSGRVTLSKPQCRPRTPLDHQHRVLRAGHTLRTHLSSGAVGPDQYDSRKDSSNFVAAALISPRLSIKPEHTT